MRNSSSSFCVPTAVSISSIPASKLLFASLLLLSSLQLLSSPAFISVTGVACVLDITDFPTVSGVPAIAGFFTFVSVLPFSRPSLLLLACLLFLMFSYAVEPPFPPAVTGVPDDPGHSTAAGVSSRNDVHAIMEPLLILVSLQLLAFLPLLVLLLLLASLLLLVFL